MKLNTMQLALAVALCASSASALAAGAVLSVTGTITPSPCAITLSSTNFGFGTTTATAFTALTEVTPPGAIGAHKTLVNKPTTQVDVNCPAPSKVRVLVTDNTSVTSSIPDHFGLGKAADGTTKIGGMKLALTNVTVGGAQMNKILTTVSGGGAWASTPVANYVWKPGAYLAPISNDTSTSPDLVRVFALSLEAQALIQKTVSTAAKVDLNGGSGTFTLSYL